MDMIREDQDANIPMISKPYSAAQGQRPKLYTNKKNQFMSEARVSSKQSTHFTGANVH